jgi:hypothetical protein
MDLRILFTEESGTIPKVASGVLLAGNPKSHPTEHLFQS